ncbi:PEP-CTERM sorting domain-containing protein [Roseateles sp. UC29_93]|uniref:PEP-CTERM sorting domain-containing protein n=1 Tax=Roseateles sp. UC29_93 TaxID=3350177 RepID=UPI00366CE733
MKLMRLLILCLAWLSGAAQSAPAVTGDVTFSQLTGLYTYTYVLDTSQLPSGGFHEFGVLSNSTPSHDAPRWVSHTEPAGWDLYLAVGGWTQPGIEVAGSFWMWVTLTPETDPGKLMTFSFSTTHAPDTGTANNFFIYSGANAGPENLPVDFGRIVGPDLTVPIPIAVPEPATMLLWVVGLAALGWMQRKSPIRFREWGFNSAFLDLRSSEKTGDQLAAGCR